MSLLVWNGRVLLMRILHSFGSEHISGEISPFLRIPLKSLLIFMEFFGFGNFKYAPTCPITFDVCINIMKLITIPIIETIIMND